MAQSYADTRKGDCTFEAQRSLCTLRASPPTYRVGESVGFNFSITDPVLNNATANQATSIVAGHL